MGRYDHDWSRERKEDNIPEDQIYEERKTRLYDKSLKDLLRYYNRDTIKQSEAITDKTDECLHSQFSYLEIIEMLDGQQIIKLKPVIIDDILSQNLDM